MQCGHNCWSVIAPKFPKPVVCRSIRRRHGGRRQLDPEQTWPVSQACGAAPTVLAVSDAEAQTVGMQRRQDRREGRHQRRDDRRTGRTERREERRTGTAAGAVPAGTTTGSAK
jgi:hypothetical protein